MIHPQRHGDAVVTAKIDDRVTSLTTSSSSLPLWVMHRGSVQANRGGISFCFFYYQKYTGVCRSHLPAVFFCGYAFCGRLNPPPPNDAFMLPVSPRASLRLPPTLSRLIKRMGQYASDIKRHQSPHAVYLPRLCLSFAPSLSSLALFFVPPSYAERLQTPFDAGYQRVHLSAVVSVEQANQPASLSIAFCVATLYRYLRLCKASTILAEGFNKTDGDAVCKAECFFFFNHPCSVCSHPWIARYHPCFFTPRSDIRFPNSPQRPSSLKPTIKVMRTEATRA